LQEPTNTTGDIFETEPQVNESLRRLYRLSVYLFAVSILISILAFLLFAPTLKNPGGLFKDIFRSLAGLSIGVSAIYTLVFIVLFPVQTFYYYKFARAIRRQNPVTSQSQIWQYLLMNARISCITFTVNLVYFVVFVYAEWTLFR
jgi:hypothetical protein